MRTATIASLLLFAAPALHAENNATWKDLHYWHIGVHSSNHACFMLTRNTKDTSMLAVHLYPEKHAIEIAFQDNDWKSLQMGQKYNLDVQIDDNIPWTGPGLAYEALPGVKAVGVFYYGENSVKMIDQLAAAKKLTVSYGGKQIKARNLQETYEALGEALKCTKAFASPQQATPPKSDPFAVAPGKRDPFIHG